MSTVFFATWQCSRLGHLGRTAIVTVRAASIPAHPAKQLLRSTIIQASRSRPIDPSSVPIPHTRAIYTTSRWLAKPLDTAEQAALPATENRTSSRSEVDGRSSTLTQDELNAIFGQEIDRHGAGELLLKLQRQRREGTLDQQLPYPGQLIDRGLEYLRATYPVDEDAAIIARVDRETDGDWNLPQTKPERSRTGHSGLEEIRRINKAEREAEEAEEAAAEQAEKEAELRRLKRNAQKGLKTGALVTSKGDGRGLVLSESHQRRLERVDTWVQWSNRRVAQLREAATMKKIPQMSRWQRLWPCGVFTFSAVGLALIFAHAYTPPSQKARLFPDVPPAIAAVGTIVGINVLVYLFWKLPHAWKTMNRGFMIVPAVPRAFSMLGAAFSHSEIVHLCGNMIGVGLLGTQLHDDIGRGPFLALVVCGSVIPSFCGLVPPVMKRILITATLGASSLLTTLIGTAFVLHEGRKITFSFLPPDSTSWMNTGVILAVLISVDILNLWRHGLMPKALMNRGQAHLDYVGHLAGYATGIGAGCLIRQTDPYWGSVQRKSFWRWRDDQVEDPAAEVLMKPEAPGITADQSKS